jgi:hypothetical protein
MQPALCNLMRHRRTIWALTLIILGLVLVVPLTYGSLIFVWITGPGALLIGVGVLLLLCLVASLIALGRRR